jgi:hypothetical protein
MNLYKASNEYIEQYLGKGDIEGHIFHGNQYSMSSADTPNVPKTEVHQRLKDLGFSHQESRGPVDQFSHPSGHQANVYNDTSRVNIYSPEGSDHDHMVTHLEKPYYGERNAD